jgi:hypothetical protein
LELEVSRINRVLTKVVRGMHFHCYRTMPVPSEVALVHIQPEPDRRRHPLYVATLAHPSVSLGEGVFSYRHLKADDSETTFWVLLFFDCVEACGMIVPKSLTAGVV